MRTDFTGRRFGRLVVTSMLDDFHKATCVCDCGRDRVVWTKHLKSGATQSCGCLRNERTAAALVIHGDARAGRVTPEHKAWRAMLDRCCNVNTEHYARYGGRGITVCERWRNDYAAFLADMGRRPSPKHSLDRRDNDGPYSPDNCRWATRIEQAGNKAVTRRLTFKGETRKIVEWAGIVRIPAREIRRRIDRGWTSERALTQTPRGTGVMK